MTKFPVKLSNEVQEAIDCRQPIVGLESNVISNGLPYPKNLQLAHECDQIVRENGAVPAMTYVADGSVCVGARQDTLEELASHQRVPKLTTRDLAWGVLSGRTSSTSVSASLKICDEVGISVFASAGLGGVHRDVTDTMDISSDLHELARRRTIVVSAGVKKFLDIPKTAEYLETIGIPVVGYRTKRFPAFYCVDGGVDIEHHESNWDRIAQLSKLHQDWSVGGAFMVVVAPSTATAIDEAIVDPAIEQALVDANRKNIVGKDITKHVMRAVDEATSGESAKANFNVMLEIAEHGANLAVAISKLEECADLEMKNE